MPTTATELLRIAEHAEADALADLVGRTPAQARAALGLTAEAFADGVLVSMPHDPTDQWSRVVGVTRWTGNADDLVALARERFTRSGVRQASLQIAPAFEPDGWRETCERLGLSAGPALVKMGAEVEELTVSAAPTGPMTVRSVRPEEALSWSATMFEAFGDPADPHLAAMGAGSVDADGWVALGAWDGADLVGVGAVSVRGPGAELFGGATLPRARRRGVQGVLIRARIEAARRAGCRWVFAEAALGSVDRPGQSLRNLRRAGLRDLGLRTGWTLTV
ncbi:GNAT family N-acetyltransferase [Curtobacterium sp. 260]|uniref:GNAT family N-acetyltransferase n=1 Tax=Curtobacterium sp. 260 TaxID=2817748 RepID=UPI0027803383|nr:GNAT family N-acetyltransferase [Curtobacterium sp. 260]MDP9736145.1 GNAT superfamily N-acetyltransferase [Curtobacterium sp. 260]